MRCLVIALFAACGDIGFTTVTPVIDDAWIDITGVPDLGAFNAPG